MDKKTHRKWGIVSKDKELAGIPAGSVAVSIHVDRYLGLGFGKGEVSMSG